MDDYIKYMWETPPRCIKEHAIQPHKKLRKILLKNYGNYCTVFGLACTCGNTLFQIKGENIQDYEGIIDPISLICRKCSKSFIIFDSSIHGYDGELGENEENEERVTKNIFKCKKCDNDIFEIASMFQYSGDEKELVDEENIDKNPEDLFGCFACHSLCNNCGRKYEVTSIECS